MLYGRDTRFDEPSPCRQRALHWNKPGQTKGTQPFREATPERFNCAKVRAFMSARPAVLVAWRPAETFRCTAGDLLLFSSDRYFPG